MRHWIAAPLGLAVAVGLATVEPRLAYAQKDGPVEETFKTADGVELHGRFHAADPKAAPNAGNAPVVVFLYPPGADRDMTKGDWGGLAKEMNKAGYHVFQFDWRGHGKSKDINDKQKFWGNPYLNGAGGFNSNIKGGPPKMPIKNTLEFPKDLTNPTRYMPAYLNDLAALRLHLDAKNDNKELNSSSIYLVGAGDAATLGMAWMATEWKRPATMPTVNQLGLGAAGYEFVPQPLRGNFDEAGNDFGGAVWLTATRPTSFPEATLKKWISNPTAAPKLRENNPMLFLFAEKDAKGKNESDFFFREMLIANPPKGAKVEPLKETKMLEVKGAEQLQGIKLLGDAKIGTETTIRQYFDFIQKGRAKIASKNRKYDTPYFIDVRFFDLRP